jgi:hypothetical protein
MLQCHHATVNRGTCGVWRPKRSPHHVVREFVTRQVAAADQTTSEFYQRRINTCMLTNLLIPRFVTMRPVYTFF